MIQEIWRLHSMELSAIMIFLAAMGAEYGLSRLMNLSLFKRESTWSNIIIGSISLAFDFVLALVSIPFMTWIYHHSINQFVNHGALYWLILFITMDFMEYLFHYLSHKVNLLWAAHIVHHQDEMFNLSVGVRTSFLVSIFNLSFYMILPLLGFHVHDVLLCIFIQGVYQLFCHTKFIGKLLFIEWVLVTPSSHRVHHGKNEIYLDKNFGKVLIIWDRIFGTYQAETEPVDYGVLGTILPQSALPGLFGPIQNLVYKVKLAKGFVPKTKIVFEAPGKKNKT